MSLSSSYKDELLLPHFVIIVPNLIVDIVVLLLICGQLQGVG